MSAAPGVPGEEELPVLPAVELAARLAEAYRLIGELTERNERLARRARDVSSRAPPGLPWELAWRMDGGEMWYPMAADLVVAVHLLFISFVVGGAFLAWRWPRIIWAHLPAMVYGALVEFTGFTCPLTPLENYLRHRAGEAGYRGGFIAHYLVAVIYPPGLYSRDATRVGRPGGADCDRRVLGLLASACTRQGVSEQAPGSSPRLALCA